MKVPNSLPGSARIQDLRVVSERAFLRGWSRAALRFLRRHSTLPTIHPPGPATARWSYVRWPATSPGCTPPGEQQAPNERDALPYPGRLPAAPGRPYSPPFSSQDQQPEGSILMSATEGLFETDVFVDGEEGFDEYGVPSIVTSRKGTLLAFCESAWRENRKTPQERYTSHIVLKRSFDNGRTWGGLQLLAESPRGKQITNPCAVVDRVSGAIWLTYNHQEREKVRDGVFANDNQVKAIHSDYHDDGATWSPPRDITEQVRRPAGGSTPAVRGRESRSSGSRTRGASSSPATTARGSSLSSTTSSTAASTTPSTPTSSTATTAARPGRSAAACPPTPTSATWSSSRTARCSSTCGSTPGRSAAAWRTAATAATPGRR